jgi:hypothetical protein
MVLDFSFSRKQFTFMQCKLDFYLAPVKEWYSGAICRACMKLLPKFQPNYSPFVIRELESWGELESWRKVDELKSDG